MTLAVWSSSARSALTTLRRPTPASPASLAAPATYACLAARCFAPTTMSSVVGQDFPAAHRDLLDDRDIDLSSLETADGPHLPLGRALRREHERARNHLRQSQRAGGFRPQSSPARGCGIIRVLGKHRPSIQLRVLDQVEDPRFVLVDSMDFWIEGNREQVARVFQRCDCVVLNDEEIRLFGGHANIRAPCAESSNSGLATSSSSAASSARRWVSDHGWFFAPAYPLEDVVDPTGAGDAFAGAFVGSLAATGSTDESALRRAVVYGSVAASFTVEAFSVERLAGLTRHDIDSRYVEFSDFCRVLAASPTPGGICMATAHSQSEIADASLADDGVRRIEWADQSMPVLESIRRRFERERPLDGLRIGSCLHVTAETANLVRTLQAGGAEPSLCASNPLSTQDDVAAALVHVYGASTYAINGEDSEIYYDHIESVLNSRPHLTTDDGADLVSTIHTNRTDVIDGVMGGTEETTTGVIRLRAMAAEGVLRYPIVAVNEAMTKHMFDNRYGTGQSTLDGGRARHQPAAGRPYRGGGWLRLVRTRPGQPSLRDGRAHDRDRSRSGACAGSRDGRLPCDAHAGGGRRGRRVYHRHRRQARDQSLALRSYEGRRGPGQLRALRRRNRH